MEKRLAIGQGVKILDQKTEGGSPPASLRFNKYNDDNNDFVITYSLEIAHHLHNDKKNNRV